MNFDNTQALHRRRRLESIFFDLDGTLADTALDFSELRRRLRFESPTAPILETIKNWPETQREWAGSVIHEFELEGAARARIYDGVYAFLDFALRSGLNLGVFTRNSRLVTDRILKSLQIPIQNVITRDDAEPKPHPEGLLRLMQLTGSTPDTTLYVGDYLYDLEAGQAAGVPTALFLSSSIDIHSAPMGAKTAEALLSSALFQFSGFDELQPQLQRHFCI